MYSIQFNEVVRYEKFKFDPNFRLPNTKHYLYSDAHAVLEVAKLEYKSDQAPVPSIKMFLSEARELTPTNFWTHDYAGHTDEGTKNLESLIPGKVFNNPKPVWLIRRMLEHACNGPGDIVLDIFAGSCVTGQATIELNIEDGGDRKFILVQMPEPVKEESNAAKAGFSTIAEIGKERIRSVIKNAQESLVGQLDLHIDCRHSATTPDDVIHEILLKAGFPLSTKVEMITLAGSEVCSIECGALLICLEENITYDLIDALADANPSQIICLDEGFKGNDLLKINAVQTFKVRAQAGEFSIVFKTI